MFSKTIIVVTEKGKKTMLIKVTGIEGGAYLINPNRIMLIEYYESEPNKKITQIIFKPTEFLRVQESFDEILELIERSENGKRTDN